MDQGNIQLIWAFIGFELYTGIGFTLLQLTALRSPNVHRSRVWHCWCTAATLHCASFCILFFSGQQFKGHRAQELCLAQASLVYSGTALYCFWHDTVTQSSTPHPEGYILIPLLLYWRILSACSGDDDAAAASRRARSPWLLVGLIALWILLTLVYVMIGVNSPDNGVTERTETSVYCYFRSPLLRVSVRGVCAILILPGVFILVLIVRSVIRARNTPIAQKYTSTVIKLIVMLIISFIALIVAFTTPSNQQVDLVINTTGHAFLPAVAMMLFASQRQGVVLLLHVLDPVLCFVLLAILFGTTIYGQTYSWDMSGSSFPCLFRTCVYYKRFIVTPTRGKLHWRISFASSPGRTVLAERARSPWLLAGPIALWLILTLIYVIFGTSSLSNAAPTLDNGLYCTFPNPFPRTFNSVVCLIISLIDVFLLGLVLRAIIRHENKSIAHQYKGTVIRVVIMIVLGLAAVIATAIMASQDQSSIAVHIAGQACLPAAVMTLFGSQKVIDLNRSLRKTVDSDSTRLITGTFKHVERGGKECAPGLNCKED
uniref:Uncharacterized protein n=1 Tax=Moniliophthora roreri TaxID=221103 RepID=A0A0W0FA66_MONRR